MAKFDNDFIKEFGFSTKNTFFEYCVQIGLANTTGVIKNRMDLFDYFFPNKRKGWWQKGDAYIHRKLWIDSLFKLLYFCGCFNCFYRIAFNGANLQPI